MTRRKKRKRRRLVKKRKLYFGTSIRNLYLPTAVSYVLGYVEIVMIEALGTHNTGKFH